MKKLLSLLAATGLVATSGSVAVACNKKADDKATTDKKDLGSLAKKELGEIQLSAGETMPSVKELVAAINKANASYGLGESDVEIATSPAQTVTGATLKAKAASTKFTGSVAVTYTVKEFVKQDLSTITGNDLKLTPTANTQAAAETAAIAKIKEKLGVDVVKDTDFTDTYKEATEASKPGSLVVTAKTGSKLLTESKSVTFSLAYVAPGTSPSIPDVSAPEVKIGETKSFDVTVENGDGKTSMSADVKSDSTAFLEEVSAVVDGSNKNKFTVSYKGKATSDAAKITLTYGKITKDVTVKVTAAETVTKDDLSKVTDKTIENSDNQEGTAQTAALAKINAKFSNKNYTAQDLKFTNFQAAGQSGKKGSIQVDPADQSTKLTGTVTFTWPALG
ncbi:hypothetical protein SHELI_v1c10120 [Spiroplasma helicoides]|uniref:Spiralin n=1 Tax=Spiroplasma helicoides TaxID=216938 RepID=A0A1B3SLZ3_9MOLU|nr:lipoprotein [Spiroplasma helicoides]AOG60959.1 hypothetical protein SHELI_v1c10120 [Spiroplasma helicoides]